MEFKIWLEQQLERIPLNKLIMSRKSMFRTMQDCAQNRGSRSSGPITVFAYVENFQLTDGYHRVFESMLQGADSVLAYVDHHGSEIYAVADENDRLLFKPHLKYKGLEDLADISILNNIRKKIGK